MIQANSLAFFSGLADSIMLDSRQKSTKEKLFNFSAKGKRIAVILTGVSEFVLTYVCDNGISDTATIQVNDAPAVITAIVNDYLGNE